VCMYIYILFSVIGLCKQMNTLESIKVNPSFLLHHFLHDVALKQVSSVSPVHLSSQSPWSFPLPSTVTYSSTFSSTANEMKPSPGGDNIRTSQAHQLGIISGHLRPINSSISLNTVIPRRCIQSLLLGLRIRLTTEISTVGHFKTKIDPDEADGMLITHFLLWVPMILYSIISTARQESGNRSPLVATEGVYLDNLSILSRRNGRCCTSA